jgi:hypothetical protein
MSATRTSFAGMGFLPQQLRGLATNRFAVGTPVQVTRPLRRSIEPG